MRRAAILTVGMRQAQQSRMIRPANWTANRLAGIGLIAGLVALFLWPLYGEWPQVIGWPFMAALAVAAACGIVLLWITMRDIQHRSGRGSRLKPIRAFDVILGLLLSVPSLVELRAIVPDSLAGLGL
jgi:hypothetical protein